MIDLAKRVVACKHWRWMPGMLPTHGSRIIYAVGERAFVAWWSHEEEEGDVHWFGTGLPDLDDDATIGCLTALVREAWGCHGSVWKVGKTFRYIGSTYSTDHCRSEAEALVVALEAAAKPRD